jgi:polysaccharide export outer membrane protein
MESLFRTGSLSLVSGEVGFSMWLRFLRRVSWVPLAAVLLQGFPESFAQATPPDKPLAASKSSAPSDLKDAPESSPSYKIGVGDVLHITVWEEPQFTEVAVVRPDGMVSIPLVSEVPVAGMTPQSAEAVLTAQLEKYVHKPRVTVTVQDIRSRMVYVTGEVQRPGAYPLLDSMNVVQLIARSGGPTDFAKKSQIYVLRKGGGARVNVDYRKVLKGQSTEQNVELAPGDTVVVP